MNTFNIYSYSDDKRNGLSVILVFDSIVVLTVIIINAY